MAPHRRGGRRRPPQRHPLDAAADAIALAARHPLAAAASLLLATPQSHAFASLSLGGGRSPQPPLPPPPADADVAPLPPPRPAAKAAWRAPWDKEKEAGAARPAPSRPRSLFGVRLPDVALPPFNLPYLVSLAPPGHPDKARLVSVADFFEYSRATAKDLFAELDADGDGWCAEGDVRRALAARGLPPAAASRLVAAARGGRWWSARFSWPEFAALCAAREPAALRAFTSLSPDRAGRLDAASVKAALARAGADASDAAAARLLATLGAGGGGDGVASYGAFRKVVALLPDSAGDVPGGEGVAAAWFDAASLLPLGPPRGDGGGGARAGALARAALAGGLANVVSTLAVFPLDTLKTRLQAAGAAGPAAVLASARRDPLSRLYRGVVPSASGVFVSHAVRTGAYEAALALGGAAAGASPLRAQAAASALGTALGTLVRIPTEVLKQRLQVGASPNASAALKAAVAGGGLPGSLFVGTVPLLLREVPFYALGTVFYTAFKRVADGSAASAGGDTPARDLSRAQLLLLGGAAGAAASLFTTPADVVKTRCMTAAAGAGVSAASAAAAVLRDEGVLALWRGALPRALWVAPLGAMNFAGTELIKKGLDEGVDKRMAALG